MNASKIRREIEKVIAENRRRMTPKQARKQYAPGKAQLAKLTELGILDYMPAGFGFSDADAVIRAATAEKSAIMNAFGEGEEVPASALHQAIKEESASEEVIQLSAAAPRQNMRGDIVGNSGSTDGDNLHVWFDEEHGWCACFSGIADGNYYESDDQRGFDTKEQAVEFMRSIYVASEH